MRGEGTFATKVLAAVGAMGAAGFLLVLDLERRDVRMVTKALPMLASPSSVSSPGLVSPGA